MAPFSDLVPEVFRSPVSHYRMRAEFRIWHDGDDLCQFRGGGDAQDLHAGLGTGMDLGGAAHQAQCLYQTFRDKAVCLTGGDFTGRVIVCQHNLSSG